MVDICVRPKRRYTRTRPFPADALWHSIPSNDLGGLHCNVANMRIDLSTVECQAFSTEGTRPPRSLSNLDTCLCTSSVCLRGCMPRAALMLGSSFSLADTVLDPVFPDIYRWFAVTTAAPRVSTCDAVEAPFVTGYIPPSRFLRCA